MPPYCEPPYPALSAVDFGPTLPYRVEVHHGGRMVVIGDAADLSLQRLPAIVTPTPGKVDVVIHGLPGRFIEQLMGCREIPVQVVVELLDAAGIPRGTPLRLLACHAGEAPVSGRASAESFAVEWGADVEAPNGLLHVLRGIIRIDLEDWDSDPLGGMSPRITGAGQGKWLVFRP